jgi:titin
MLKNVEVMEGQNVHLEARLSPTGDPTMRVEWTLNGKPLKTGKYENKFLRFLLPFISHSIGISAKTT